MIEEINRQIAVQNKENAIVFDAAILWALHICFGFGKDRLRRFYDTFYVLFINKDKWAQGRTEIEMLKGIGVDIEAWNEEVRKK